MRTRLWKKQLTLRQVLGITYFLSIVLLAVATLLLVREQLSTHLRAELLSEGKTIAQRLAEDSRMALIQWAPENAQTSMALARAFPNIDEVAVYTRAGERLAGSLSQAVPFVEIQAAGGSQRRARLLREDDRHLFIVAPVTAGTHPQGRDPFEAGLNQADADLADRQQTLIGFVLLTVSKAALEGAVSSMQRQLLLSTALVAVPVFLAILVLVHCITYPFKQLAGVMTDPDTPRQYTQAAVYGIQEAREIASSFNALMLSFAKVNQELSKINEELEARVLERTQALIQTNQALQHANEAKSRFLSSVSHELRTPLQGVITSANLLMSTQRLGPEPFQYAQIIHTSAHLLLDLISGILDTAKIEAGKITLEAVDFDLHRVLQPIIITLLLQAEAKQLRLDLHVDPDTPYQLRGDRTRLSQILMNLAGNAVKFTERGAVRLKVSKIQESDAEAVLRFEVIDTGIGIPAEAQERIFDYFTQADESISRRYGGTGLGTTLAKLLVQLMGGRIGVQSEVGRGSCFWFEVPFQKPAEAAPAERLIPGLRALIVSADTDEAAAWAQWLHLWGVESHKASSWEQTLQALHEAAVQLQPFTSVLVDKRAVSPSARAFAEDLLRDGAGRLASLMLIRSTPGDKDACFEAGYTAVLGSPVDNEHLYRALRASRQVRWGFAAVLPDARFPARPLRILVAEDNATNQQLLGDLLQAGGHAPHLVSDGSQALKALETDEFDLTILDMHMPGLKGHEVIERYRRCRPDSDLPTILLTADDTRAAMMAAQAAGVEAYLTKPVSPEVLFEAINRYGLKHRSGGLTENATLPATSPVAPAVQSERLALRAGMLEHAHQQVKAPAVLSKLRRTFIQDAERTLERIDMALENEAFEDVQRAVHAFRSAAAAVGAESIRGLCADIERAVTEHREQDLKRLIGHLRSAIGEATNLQSSSRNP